MRQISIKIPEKKDFKRWGKILRFKLSGGFSCKKCGMKTDFDHVKFESDLNSKRLILSNGTAGICADCTIKELNEKADIVFTEDNCTCDWCEKPKATTSFPRHKDLESTIIFGGQWWNGHHICQSCLTTGFKQRGPIHSGHSRYKNKVEYCANELGLWIEKK